jgi:hypothetical protein
MGDIRHLFTFLVSSILFLYLESDYVSSQLLQSFSTPSNIVPPPVDISRPNSDDLHFGRDNPSILHLSVLYLVSLAYI